MTRCPACLGTGRINEFDPVLPVMDCPMCDGTGHVAASGGEDPPDAVDRVKESDGELVLDFHTRVGARPYVRFDPEEEMWECLSLLNGPSVDPTFQREILKAEPVIEESWLREQIEIRCEPVDVIDYDDSPFPNRDSYERWTGRGSVRDL